MDAQNKWKRLTVIVGLPGSGKTRLGRLLSDETIRVFVDDVDKNGGLQHLSRVIAEEPAHLLVSDPNLCVRENQKNAEAYFQAVAKNYNILWLFFENAPEKCLAYVQLRVKDGDERKVDGAIVMWSQLYHIPKGAKVLNVWQPGEESDAMLAELKKIV